MLQRLLVPLLEIFETLPPTFFLSTKVSNTYANLRARKKWIFNDSTFKLKKCSLTFVNPKFKLNAVAGYFFIYVYVHCTYRQSCFHPRGDVVTDVYECMEWKCLKQ